MIGPKEVVADLFYVWLPWPQAAASQIQRGRGSLSFFQEHPRRKVEPLTRGDPGLSLASLLLSLSTSSILPFRLHPFYPRDKLHLPKTFPCFCFSFLETRLTSTFHGHTIVVMSLEPDIH